MIMSESSTPPRYASTRSFVQKSSALLMYQSNNRDESIELITCRIANLVASRLHLDPLLLMPG